MLKVLGLCGGNGVLLYPFERSEKFKVIGNIEPRALFYSPGNKQWNSNFPKRLMVKTIEPFMKNRPDIIIGHPNCGHSSKFTLSRMKKYSDARDDKSVDLWFEGIKKLNPKVFLMENLRGFMKDYTLMELTIILESYDLICWENVSVSKFGNSQINRERMILIGISREFTGVSSFKLSSIFNEICKVTKIKNTRRLLRNLPDNGNVTEKLTDKISLYSKYKLSLQEIKDEWERRPGEKRWKVEGRNFTTAPGVYRNLDDDYPATVRKTNRQFNSSGIQMGPREMARIQGIPDRFNIYIDHEKLNYWINKGRVTVAKTPPYEIGKWFKQKCAKAYDILIDDSL